jgi:TolA-binding protein
MDAKKSSKKKAKAQAEAPQEKHSNAHHLEEKISDLQERITALEGRHQQDLDALKQSLHMMREFGCCQRPDETFAAGPRKPAAAPSGARLGTVPPMPGFAVGG